MFALGKTYRRIELHRLYGGQQQGGISTPTRHNFIFLFTGKQGQTYGYRDEWTEEGLFLFTGEGQRGDMTFQRGNSAIRDHAASGKDLHLFEYIRRGLVRYVSQMVCVGFRERSSPDLDGNARRVIVFDLLPIDALVMEDVSMDLSENEAMWSDPLEALRHKAMVSATLDASPRESRSLARYRSNAIRTYVLRRADGICEACGDHAPFTNTLGRPYLEPHHIRRLSDGGPDHPEWVIALCPNCHRRAHHANDREEFNRKLEDLVRNREAVVLKSLGA